jgi:hypothetical protein
LVTLPLNLGVPNPSKPTVWVGSSKNLKDLQGLLKEPGSNAQLNSPLHLAAAEFLFPRISGENAVGIQFKWIRFWYKSFIWTVSVKPLVAAKW